MVSATRRNATGTGAAAGAMRNAAAGKKVRLSWTAIEERQGAVHPWLSSASSAMFCTSQQRLRTQLELMLCGCCGVCRWRTRGGGGGGGVISLRNTMFLCGVNDTADIGYGAVCIQLPRPP